MSLLLLIINVKIAIRIGYYECWCNVNWQAAGFVVCVSSLLIQREECCFLQGRVGFHTSVLYYYGYVLMCRNIVLCDYCHPILTAICWSKSCEPHLWQIGITVNVACFHPVWFEWSLMLVVRLNNVLLLLWYVQWVGISYKCEMWPTDWQGAVCCVQGKVECSAAVCVIPP